MRGQLGRVVRSRLRPGEPIVLLGILTEDEVLAKLAEAGRSR